MLTGLTLGPEERLERHWLMSPASERFCAQVGPRLCVSCHAAGVQTFLGDKSKFAVEVGDWERGLRRVDLWAADQWLTCKDNMVYVPQFCGAVSRTAAWVRSGQVAPLPFTGLGPVATHQRFDVLSEAEELDGEHEPYWILNEWGPTIDNLIVYGFRDGARLTITFQFWREEHLAVHPEHVGTVFEVEMEAAEFAGILDDLAAVLDRG